MKNESRERCGGSSAGELGIETGKFSLNQAAASFIQKGSRESKTA